ncbi:hypothetical protein PG994_013520 [Apiospora phragmitis]|uniref:Rhodopsin domain-containing protein n=1 Tax=Apiospora phragmitis TaxID=2905665 RepID=A0ABR1T8U7_9PEZI
MGMQDDAARDQGPTIQVLIWFLFTSATLSVVLGMGMKFAVVRKLGWDDLLLVLAHLNFLWRIDWSGEVMEFLGEESREGYLKARSFPFRLHSLYIADPRPQAEYTSLLQLGFIKGSIAVFIRKLSERRGSWLLHSSLCLAVGLWLVSAALTSLFQCAPPRPWDYVNGSRCLDRACRSILLLAQSQNKQKRAWWAYVSGFNILSELCIVALYFSVVLKVQMSRTKKFVVLSVFSTRVL